MSTNTVEIQGEEWPVKLNYTALKRNCRLVGLKYVTDVNKLGEMVSGEGEQGVPIDLVPDFIRNLIVGGLIYTQDKRDPPPVEAVEAALNEDFGLYGAALMGINEEAIDKDEKPVVEGKKKPGTRKPSR